MLEAEIEYICVGGNRQPGAADWKDDQLAFGAGINIALWNPKDPEFRGITRVLAGHSETVTAVKFLDGSPTGESIISGSTDKTIRAWDVSLNGDKNSVPKSRVIGHHDSSITAIAVLKGHSKVFSAGSDSAVKIWDLAKNNENGEAPLALQTLKLKIIPLAISVHNIDATSTILAVGGTHSSIQIYTSTGDENLIHSAALTGHSGWIRALSFTHEGNANSDVILASASQDKFVRLWRLHQGSELPSSKHIEDPSLGMIGKTVSTKAHRFKITEKPYSITFEALLFGHEDWILSCSWFKDDRLRLLTSSADNSLTIWEADPATGIWLSASRLGDISAEKGSTTATGSVGGFWVGLWSPDGSSVASLGRTGSWRVWKNLDSGRWEPQIGCGGHVRSVTDIAWSRSGDYLLTTSLDQTTRLHAAWKSDNSVSWHEFARPQIHGYDLNCIDTISDELFISGADEKPLRVFKEPGIVADILNRLCGASKAAETLPDAANIPVLGLSNQAIQAVEDSVSSEQVADGGEDTAITINFSTLQYNHPPLEDHLSKHLLWPETQKVYGHGFEISSVAVSHDGTLVATACKASSIDHAVIRVYDTKEWREYCKPLSGHTLTVTDMKWSPDDKYLLSVGRDRTWSIFERTDSGFTSTTSKGHTRMILSCAWVPSSVGRMFVTAGRDKVVKLWSLKDGKFDVSETFTFDSPVTAVDVLPGLLHGNIAIASGLESGKVHFTIMSSDLKSMKTLEMTAPSPTTAITKLAWRGVDDLGDGVKLAIASEDHTARIVHVEVS